MSLLFNVGKRRKVFKTFATAKVRHFFDICKYFDYFCLLSAILAVMHTLARELTTKN